MRARVTPSLLALVVVLTAATGIALGSPAGVSPSTDEAVGQSPSNATNDTQSGSVNVSVGAQLSTVVSSTSTEVQTEVENSDFAYEFESADGDRAEAVADRVAELRDRTAEIRESYREATEEYEAGDLSRDEYAQRLAELNARAEAVQQSLRQVEARAADLDASTAPNATDIQGIAASLDNVTGAGPAALLQRFTGQSRGELEIRVDGGLRIEAESEDGERSREIRRQGDDSRNVTVSQDSALQTARGALSAQAGNWTLVEATVHEDDGQHRFEFTTSGGTLTSEAEVRVDGSSGDVVRLEEEIERDDDSDDEREEREDETEDGDDETEEEDKANEPEENETEDEVGENETAEDDADDTETGENDTEDADESDPSKLAASVTVEDGTATATITYDGSPLSDATVEVESDEVGQTDANGTVTFAVPADAEDFEIAVEKGDLEGETTYRVVDGEAEQLSPFGDGGSDDD